MTEPVPTIAEMVAEASYTDPGTWPFTTWGPPVRALGGDELRAAAQEVAVDAMLRRAS